METSRAGSGGVVIRERGTWEPRPGVVLGFHGAYRWSRQDSLLAVEHLRHGDDRPVRLLLLAPGKDDAWESVEPYHCGKDEYLARLIVAPDALVVQWQIHGPYKNQTLVGRYTAGD